MPHGKKEPLTSNKHTHNRLNNLFPPPLIKLLHRNSRLFGPVLIRAQYYHQLNVAGAKTVIIWSDRSEKDNDYFFFPYPIHPFHPLLY